MHRDQIKPFRGSAEDHVQRLTALRAPAEVIEPMVPVAADSVPVALSYSRSRGERFPVLAHFGARLWDLAWIPLLAALCCIFVLPADHFLNFAVIPLLIGVMAVWTMSCRWRRRERLAEPINLHRNNAAEWVLYAALLPLVPFAWAWERVRRKRGAA